MPSPFDRAAHARTQESNYQKALAGALEAIEAHSKGEPHPRLRHPADRYVERIVALNKHYEEQKVAIAQREIENADWKMQEQHGVYPENTKGRYLGD